MHKTGNPGPSLTEGTYLVVARALLTDPGGGDELESGRCDVSVTSVSLDGFSQPFLLWGGWNQYSFVGTVVVFEPGEIELSCWISTGGFTPSGSDVEWWISPIVTSESDGGGGGGSFGGGGDGDGGFGGGGGGGGGSP